MSEQMIKQEFHILFMVRREAMVPQVPWCDIE